ncbi:MAG: glycosyltransferase [Myxococcaceae bacterium]|nr:glycosyltransferase [Myxococcaceae bacterium]
MLARDMLCFSHLRWNFVFQRPNHLMSRFARQSRVFFIEEPVFDASVPHLERSSIEPNLIRIVPHLPSGRTPEASTSAVRALLVGLSAELQLGEAIHWFYTPLMLPWTEGLTNSLVVYDCMDELSNFHFAPPELVEREAQLMRKADIVFTGGMALYAAKRDRHPNVHGVPSSVDVPFFSRAREPQIDPPQQASIPRARVGYCGVIDERIDLHLVAELARARPQVQFVMVGPVVKISPESLPRSANIHYLGSKPYAELPSYMAGWDAAIMPFALNDATRFISPTKTPEYLAAGKRVVSTAIPDVVEPYERLGLVRIGRSPSEFVALLDAALQDDGSLDEARDAFLATHSWEATWQRMQMLMTEATRARRGAVHASSEEARSGTTAAAAE